MDALQQEKIYNRLLEITLEIEFENIPSPDYINKKIGECNGYIEEIEKHSIQISREQSAVLRSLNNSVSHYEYLKQNLMSSNPEIKSLPNIKDREAKADSLLKEQLDSIKSFKNDMMDLKNLSKAVDLKIKNLCRANNDIKMQLRLMESHIKLGASPQNDIATQSLLEEMRKSTFGEDSFGGDISSEGKVDKIIDPSDPVDIESLLSSDEERDIQDHLLNPDFEPSLEIQECLKQDAATSPDPQNNKGDSVDAPKVDLNAPVEPQTLIVQAPEPEQEEVGTMIPEEDPIEGDTPSPDILREVDQAIADQSTLDLESIMNPKDNEGKKEDPVVVVPPKKEDLVVVQTKNEIKSESSMGIDIDALLKDIT